MKAVLVRTFGGPEVLELADIPVPRPGPGQVRIRTVAAAVNPVDVQTRSGALTSAGLLPPKPVLGLGWDVAGIVDELGAGVVGLSPGDQVIGLSDRLALAAKAQAEQVVLDADAVAVVPPGTDLTAAATLPLNGLTAAQALDLLPSLTSGATVLVTGAAGGVGGYAVELAARRGLRVVAVAARRDAALVRELGAEFFVPRDADLADTVRDLVPAGVDAAVDAAHLGVVALDAVRNGGDFVALTGATPVPLRGVRISNVWIRADGVRLAELAALGLRPRVADTLPLDRVRTAHERLERGGLRGRLVLVA
ncbi:NADP-dependent oxidoreductase [Micromonospora sp. NPDC049559]|uniref:NADP-dependent oxidoreductase n=1 Tax=Micromonospora sp. NPDC049559 TaxID=3155923 RepID=UPI00342654A5